MGRDRTFEKKTKYGERGAVLKTVVHKTFCRVVIVVLQKKYWYVWHQWQKIKYILYSLSSKISTSMHADTVLGALFLHKGFKTESVHTSLALELLRFGVTLPKSAITISSSEH